MEEVSIKNVKNWAKSQKKDFDVKIVKKCLTTYHESDKINKLSAAKAGAHRTLKIEQYRKNL